MDNEQRWQRALELAESIEAHIKGQYLASTTRALAWQSGDGNAVRVYTGHARREYIAIRRDGTARAAYRTSTEMAEVIRDFNEALEVAA